MRVHFDVLGWLHLCAGAFGLLTGASLAVLALGTSVALAGRLGATASLTPTVWFLSAGAVTFAVAGAITCVVGRALLRRGRFARRAALVLSAPGLLVAPFGTALGIYTFWTLLNDEARREFEPGSR